MFKQSFKVSDVYLFKVKLFTILYYLHCACTCIMYMHMHVYGDTCMNMYIVQVHVHVRILRKVRHVAFLHKLTNLFSGSDPAPTINYLTRRICLLFWNESIVLLCHYNIMLL